jgi:AbrB family looped-hinge helix DNA binding protein
MRVTTKGQVTIPKHVRDQLGIGPGSEVAFELAVDKAYLRKVEEVLSPEERQKRFEQVLTQLRKTMGTATSGLTTDEIMDMTRGPFDDLDPD